MNIDNNLGELAGQNGQNSTVHDNGGSPEGSSKQSPETAAAQAERRRRTISISEYKQRKKSADMASSTPTNNNDIHFKIEPGITIDLPLATPQTLPTVPKSNGQATSLDRYYAQIYYQQHYLASQGQAFPPIPTLHESTPSTHPPAPHPAPSYPYWSTPTSLKPPEPPNINSTQSRMHRVEDWASTTPQRLPNPPRPLNMSFNHSESPPHTNNSFPSEKTQKLTPASALNDPSQPTSYREWKKRKYGTEDPPNSTPTNPSKFRRTDSWRDKGGPRGNNNRKSGNQSFSGSTEDNWDDNKSSAPAPSNDSALDNWDDDPAPAPAQNPVTSESWDDAPAPQAKKSDDMDNWDDDAAPPAANKDVMINLESWDDNSAPPKLSDNPPKSYGAWEATSAPPSRPRAPPPAPRAGQGTLDSWDDETSAQPPQPSQIALESWDDDPAPAANPVTIEDWEPTPVTQLPSSGNDDSFWNAQPSPRNHQDQRNNYRGNNRSRNDSGSHQSRDNYRGQRSNSRDNSESRGFRHDYRAGSKSSDNNSESGYSNYQNRGNRGNNRGRNRSGSRDSGQWNRNGSRDRSEGRQGWKSNNGNNYQGRRNNGNYQDRRNNGGFNKRNDSWNQPPPPPDVALESWDDDPAPPQPSKQMESWNASNSNNNQGQSWNNSSNSSNYGRSNYSNVPSTLVNPQELESWDDDEAPPQARVPEDAEPVGPVQENVQIDPLIIHPQVNNSNEKESNMVKALCITCSYQLVHRCKYTKDPATWDTLTPGDLHICRCGMAFLHGRNCIDKVGESYAPEKSETALLKQVGRSLVYACDGCEFKFTIENIKEPVHFFKQLTIKTGDKLRGKAAINDPIGIEVFLHHIEGINNIACVGMDDAMRDKSSKDKMSRICHCNKGCCTIYHECQVYEGIDDVGEN